MLDFTSFPKSETPISCELKTYMADGLRIAMKIADVTEYQIRFWRSCSEKEKQTLFSEEANRATMLLISPYTKEQTEKMYWSVFTDEEIRKKEEEKIHREIVEMETSYEGLYEDILGTNHTHRKTEAVTHCRKQFTTKQ